MYWQFPATVVNGEEELKRDPEKLTAYFMKKKLRVTCFQKKASEPSWSQSAESGRLISYNKVTLFSLNQNKFDVNRSIRMFRATLGKSINSVRSTVRIAQCPSVCYRIFKKKVLISGIFLFII